MGSRLKAFRKANDLTQDILGEYLGIKKSFVSQLEHGLRPISDKHIESLLNNPYNWDTSMLKDCVDITATTTGDRNVVTIASNNRINAGPGNNEPSVEDVERIPVIPSDAHAGALSDYADSVMPYQCETMLSPIRGASCAIRVYGDSMSPKYASGSLAILRKVDASVFVEWGKTYVLDTVNGAIMKVVNPSEKDGEVMCESMNPAYKPFSIRTSDVRGWYRVLGCLMFD